MNIKDRRIEWNFPSIYFKNNFSNGAFIFIISVIIINYFFAFLGWDNFSIEKLSIFVFVTVLIFIMLAAGPGEAFNDNYVSSDPESAIADLKRAAIYMLIGAFVVSLVHFYKVTNYVAPSPKIVTKTRITSFKFIDLHANKDTYAIRYYDIDGKELFTDVYTKKVSRDKVKMLIYKNGEVVVDMMYINDGGQERVEISQKAVHL